MKSHLYMPLYFHLQIKYLIGFLLKLRQGFVSVFKRMTIRSAKIEPNGFFLLQIYQHCLPLISR
jgi:hypothetical protein